MALDYSFVTAKFLVLGLTLAAGASSVIVNIPQGKLQGKQLLSRGGREFLAFLQVPYGQAERFESPKPAGKWKGTLGATEYGQSCPQMAWTTFQNFKEENCLALHVFTPNISAKLPVVVYIHGGGFSQGASNALGPTYFMDEEIVLVIVSYRLGPFGFLSTLDEAIPGNYGLKDQSLSLKWVQENIENFGGDPTSVTIYGHSTGAAAVNYHLMSPLSSGLFHAAIAQSGSSLDPWARSTKPKEVAGRFGKALNCSFEDSKDYKNCLMKKSTDEILTAVKHLVQWGTDPLTPFAPVVEPDLPGAFLVEEPFKLMESGRFHKVPVITGVNEDEGIAMSAVVILNNPNLLRDFNQDWKRVYPATFNYDEMYTNWNEKKRNEVSAQIREYYFRGQNVSKDNPEIVTKLINVYSDRYFNHGVSKAAILMAKHAPVYTYVFAHNRMDFTFAKYFGTNKNYGVSHADDATFHFSNVIEAPEFEKGSAAEQVSKGIVKLWASFVKKKTPDALWGGQDSWKPVSQEEVDGKKPLQYCRIDTHITFIDEPFTERVSFWEKLFKTSAGTQDQL